MIASLILFSLSDIAFPMLCRSVVPPPHGIPAWKRRLFRCPPCLGWRLRVPNHVFVMEDSEIRIPSFNRFPMDSRRSQPTLPRLQSANQFSDILRNAWPPRAYMLNLPGPVHMPGCGRRSEGAKCGGCCLGPALLTRSSKHSAVFQSDRMSASHGFCERLTESIHNLADEIAVAFIFPVVDNRTWDGAQLLIEFADTVGLIVAQKRI